jgi:hypothetical protein
MAQSAKLLEQSNCFLLLENMKIITRLSETKSNIFVKLFTQFSCPSFPVKLSPSNFIFSGFQQNCSGQNLLSKVNPLFWKVNFFPPKFSFPKYKRKIWREKLTLQKSEFYFAKTRGPFVHRNFVLWTLTFVALKRTLRFSYKLIEQ